MECVLLYRFRSILRDRASSRLSTAGTDAMSTSSSRDSLLFPRIDPSRGTLGGIPRTIDASGMSKSVVSGDKRGSTIQPKSGVISSAGDFSDEEMPAGSSVVTGIPSWDKGLSKPDKAALWWLHQNESSVETAGVINDSVPESPRIGFADDSLVSVNKLGVDTGVLESLCQPRPEDDLNQSSPKAAVGSNLRHAAVQTEGRVSVFPPDSVFSGSGAVPAAGPGSWRMNPNPESLTNSSSSIVQRNVAAFLQNQSAKLSSPTKPGKTDKSIAGSTKSGQSTPTSGRSTQELSVPSLGSLNKGNLVPVPPAFASPIKKTLTVVPVDRGQGQGGSVFISSRSSSSGGVTNTNTNNANNGSSILTSGSGSGDGGIVSLFTNALFSNNSGGEGNNNQEETSLLNNKQLSTIVQLTEGYSGSDLTALCTEAAMGPIRELTPNELRTINATAIRPIQEQDYINALKVIKPSVSSHNLKQFISWGNQFGTAM